MLAFAGARDVIGRAELLLELSRPTTCRELLDRLCLDFPALAPHRGSLRLAVNGSYAFLDEAVSPGDEVALIPPVAGG
ncbi:MAG: MoaD/ThiS family protein [Polyangiaceae bacterium]|nr:MoaD/ThiS family protein [Polyangiaceae bacterium]